MYWLNVSIEYRLHVINVLIEWLNVSHRFNRSLVSIVQSFQSFQSFNRSIVQSFQSCSIMFNRFNRFNHVQSCSIVSIVSIMFNHVQSFQSFLSCFTADLTLHVWYCIFEPTIFLVWDVSLILAVASKGSSYRTMFRPQRCNRCMVINAHFVVSTNHQKKYVLQCVLKMSTLLCTPHPNWKWCAHPNWKRCAHPNWKRCSSRLKTMCTSKLKTMCIQTENGVQESYRWTSITKRNVQEVQKIETII
jgi:hypothetical protein